MPHWLRSFAPWLAVLALAAGPVAAQVPQGITFTGRLVDDTGVPLVGPVSFSLSVFDAPTGGTLIYADNHFGVPLDPEGNFSVQLGTAPVFVNFSADLLLGGDRYVEVFLKAPYDEALTPRILLSSVPYALVAQQANKVVPDPNAPRFEDCGDGTVADHQTGLQWEKKTGTVGNDVICETVACPDPHDVNNRYKWSNTGTDPDGNAFTEFLARLNGKFDPRAAAGCFADRCDWEVPKISELQTILIGPESAPGQAATCSSAPCIDPDFAAIGGPTASASYWSTSMYAIIAGFPYSASFNTGEVNVFENWRKVYVRAVRTGSCH